MSPAISLTDEIGEAIQNAFKAAEFSGQREITLRIPVPLRKQGTLLDILKMRGAPIELIASYLIAGEEKQALAAFHSSVLEYVYEKLAEDLKATVGFITRGSLKDEHYIHVYTDKQRNIGIALEPTHENSIGCNGMLTAPVGCVPSGTITGYICDDYNASVVALIDSVTTSIVKQITTQVEKARRIVPEGELKIFIIPEMSTSALTIDQAKGSPIRLGGETKIVACAFIMGGEPAK